jgi:hypothetical protein
MNYRYQWQIIASRVRGLMQSAELHTRFLSVRSSDSYGRTGRLREEGARIIAEVSSFRDRFQESLPQEVVDRIDEFKKKATPLFEKNADGTPASREELVWAGLGCVLIKSAAENRRT